MALSNSKRPKDDYANSNKRCCTTNHRCIEDGESSDGWCCSQREH